VIETCLDTAISNIVLVAEQALPGMDLAMSLLLQGIQDPIAEWPPNLEAQGAKVQNVIA
jgi:hypothetical protein